MMTICPLCQQVHLHPLQDKICKVRLQIINLRLEERDLMKELKESEMLKSNEYYIFEQLEEEVTIRYEIWSGVYGDCLINTKVEFEGSFDEAKQYLIDNGIEEVITR